ncbi:MAG TPA: hypothetical protein VID03_05325 [Acidimicrobiia bacterium]
MIGRLSAGTVRTIDVLLVFWLAFWLWVGWTVNDRVNDLSSLADGVVNTGEVIGDVGDRLGQLADVPVVGPIFEGIADGIGGVAQETISRGEDGRTAVNRTAMVLGLLFAITPTLPLLAIWLPIRVAWGRDRKAVQDGLAQSDQTFRGYLAHRAVASQPYRRLASVSSDPFGDLAAGRYEGLASLELKRLGLAAAIPPPQS